MIDSKLFRIAVETAGTEDVKSAPDTVVLYSVSYQPTTANQRLRVGVYAGKSADGDDRRYRLRPAAD